jgi:hypothetical protein
MPWYSTEMSRAAKYPTLSFLKMNYLFEILQLSVTLAAQLGIILSTEGQGTGTFTAIVVMNVAYSSLMLCLKIVDMYLKWSLLRGAAKSEDCPAAQEAWKKASGTVGAGAGDKDSGADSGDASSSSLEMGTLHARPGAAGSSMSASVRDSNDGSTLTANPMHHVTPTIAAGSGGGESKNKQEQREGGGGERSVDDDDIIPPGESAEVALDSLYSGGNRSGPMDSESGTPTRESFVSNPLLAGGGPAGSSGDAATAATATSSSSNSQKEAAAAPPPPPPPAPPAAAAPSLQEAVDLLSAELGLAREEGEAVRDFLLKAARELGVDTEGKKTKAIATACLAEIL